MAYKPAESKLRLDYSYKETTYDISLDSQISFLTLGFTSFNTVWIMNLSGLPGLLAEIGDHMLVPHVNDLRAEGFPHLSTNCHSSSTTPRATRHE